jgi:oligopeptide transport system substrate-binding protein
MSFEIRFLRYRATRPVLIKFAVVFLLSLSVILSGCLTDRQPSNYYGQIIVPRTQEFRWSDGGLPQTFDPAFAAAAPDTDLVRALFEGLTDYDPQTLRPVPGVATRWESSADNRVWTFYLRDDAKWSNGEAVTAADFVRSWQRTLRIGPLAPHTELLSNLEGSGSGRVSGKPATDSSAVRAATFGAEAVGDYVLRVRLREADASFPSLVAHPVFRPVKIAGSDTTHRLEAHELISNGAFLLSGADNDRVLLERATNYWDGDSVELERVAFVSSSSAEDALAAYHSGKVDAVTNAPFEPLALKLLSGYEDFRRFTFGALTYYSFNTAHAPFDDVRVREALAIAIDRERVTRDDLGGATEPAGKFLPDAMSGEKPVVDKTELLEQDVPKARDLLAQAGFPNGDGFPIIRLLINRNDQQRAVAQAIATMWESVLGIQTEIIIKNWDEYESAFRASDFDVVRRGMVMQTTDELTNLKMLFERDGTTNLGESSTTSSKQGESELKSIRNSPVISEGDALKELRAVPIYFASSFALVKPYVNGFDSNVLDAPSLKRTRMDTSWVDKKP